MSDENLSHVQITKELNPPMEIYLPEDYSPSEDEPYMNPQQLEYFRRNLILWREQLLNEIREMKGELCEERIRESDLLDEGSFETSASLRLKTRDRYRKLIYKIDDALERIKNGTYGYCEETGEEIGLKRLEARPIATLSLEAQKLHEQSEKLRGKYNSGMKLPY